ncbi:MAG: putative circadian clock protein KaiC [Frankiales bacterium]|nr:putative circadian clock protein KaiC [Frankiales bacterium]
MSDDTTRPGHARREGLLHLGRDGHEVGASVPKLATGIPGFDHVCMGGLPARRATVVAGQAGSAKTVFGGQFLAEGVRAGQPGVFVTLEEPAADLRANLRTLGFDVDGWEKAGDWRFVDASPLATASGAAPYSLETLTAQIGHAVDATGAERLVLDSLNGVLGLHAEPAAARQLLRQLIANLRAMGLTVVLTVETPGDPGGTLSRYGIEEFVADNVVLLRNVREQAFRRRTVEVLKMRGAMHHKGDVPFTVLPGQGIVVLPVGAPEQDPTTLDQRVSTGNEGVDRLAHGGLVRGSSTLVSGPTGTGKTLLALQFAADGAARGERVLLMAYEETRQQMHRMGTSWGHDLQAYEDQGLLRIVPLYPEVASLDDHLVEIRHLVERFEPTRLVVDSLSALERLGSPESYRGFVIGLTSYVKQIGLASMMTAAAPHLVGGTSVTESHISGLIDAIVVLRYVEVDSALKRGILVLKMRGSSHEQQICELTINEGSMTVGEPFRGLGGILTGQAVPRA